MKLRFLNRITVIIIFAIYLGYTSGIAQDSSEIREIKIKTSAKSWISKNIIESGLEMRKGVQTVDLDLYTQILTVKYKPCEIVSDAIIASLKREGYEASIVEEWKEILNFNTENSTDFTKVKL